MRRSVLVLIALAFVVSIAMPALAEPGYEGVGACGMCHKKEAKGDQVGKWKAGPHAGAYATLGTDAAKEAAAAAGIEGNPQEAAECLSCHVTAAGVDAAMLGKKYSVEDGVGCESCHGPGSEYKSMKVMKDRDASTAAGLVLPTEETCTGCHNDKSPTFKGFDFAEYSAKIAHPDPTRQ
jgi:hypothetical protein